MEDKQNVVLVDYDAPNCWRFVEGLSKETAMEWKVMKMRSNNNHSNKIQNAVRYIKYFLLPLKVFWGRRKYECVIGWQQFFGLILCFYCRLFHVRFAPSIYVMTFIYKPKKSFVGKVYENFVRYCVTSKYIKQIIVFSSYEAKFYSELFGVSSDLFSYIDLGIEDVSEEYEIYDNGRFLTAGRSNRDYNFLFDVWKDNRELDIICDTLEPQNSKNISIYNTIRDNAFLSMLSSCHAVIVPLLDENISSGQLVILQSMMFNKPVICTTNNAVYTYIDSFNDGVIISKSGEELEKAILYVETHYRELAQSARLKFESRFTEYQMGINVGKIICKYELV